MVLAIMNQNVLEFFSLAPSYEWRVTIAVKIENLLRFLDVKAPWGCFDVKKLSF